MIETLKDQSLRDPDRQAEISRVILYGQSNTLSSEQYATLVQLGKGLDDYKLQTAEAENTEEGKIDDEMGVAVVFDESDEEGNESEMEGLVRDVAESSDEDDDDDDEDEDVEGPQPIVDDDKDEEPVVQGGKDTSKKKHHGLDRVLSVLEIDAHYLQRQLSRHFDDADICAKIANDVLSVLDIRNGTDIRECENKLLVLLGFELFDTIKLLLHNRVRIWACVSIKRASSDEERSKIEELLSNHEDGAAVWKELHSTSKAEDWSRERMRGITSSLENREKDVSKALDSIGVKPESKDGFGAEAMDTDEKTSDQPTQLDLESLSFRDGAHTMSNKTCNLPSNSWRAMKKGYEEVHVPGVKRLKASEADLIPIADLPSWTHPAFKGVSLTDNNNNSIVMATQTIVSCDRDGAT